MRGNGRQRAFWNTGLIVLLVAALAGGVAIPLRRAVASEGGTVWNVVEQGSQNVSYTSASTDGKLVVIVGTKGAVVRSTDMAHWDPVNRFTGSDLYGICRGNGTYVAVGDEGTLFTSTDASSWTGHDIPGDISLAAVAFGNGVYVAVGVNGGIVASDDAALWTSLTTPVGTNLYDVVFGGGRFVAVGENGTLISSTDGRTWTDHTVAAETDLYGVAWGNNIYVAAGEASVILTSPDGVTWTRRAAAYEDLTFAAVTFAGNAFVLAADHDAIHELGTVPTRWAVFYFRSTDGLSWQNMKWQESYVWQRSNWVRRMVWTGTQLVSFGEGGSVQTSPDGMRWTYRTSTGAGIIAGMASGAGIYVGVGTEAKFNGAVYSSRDGLNWQHEINPQVPRVNENYDQWQDDLYGVAYGDGAFVAVGSYGVILRSADGHAWTVEQSGTQESLLSIARIGDLFVAVGYNGTVLTSPDGHTWTSRMVAQPNLLFWSMAAGRDSLLIMGADVGRKDSGTVVMSLPVSSLRGTATIAAGPLIPIGGSAAKTWMAQVAYGNDRFVAVADDSGASWYSDDGVRWQAASPAFMSIQRSVTFVQGVFVSVGDNQSIATSPDGVAWTSRQSGSAAFSRVLREDYLCTFGDAQHVFATSSWGTVALSDDGGEAWSGSARENAQDLSLTAVSDTPGALVAVGELGTVRTSLDGISWRTRATGASGWLWDVAATPVGTVAVGESGLVARSSDLATWTLSDAVTDQTLTSVAAGGGHLVAVGDGGTVISSDDGRNWALQETGFSADMIAVTYGAAKFVAVGQGGMIATSTDGSSWKQVTGGVASDLNDILFSDNRFVVVGSGGTVLTSTDAVTWTRQSSGTTASLFGVASGGGVLLVVGDRGTALVSADAVRWTSVPAPTKETLYGCAARSGIFVTAGTGSTVMWTSSLAGSSTPVPVRPLSGASVDPGSVELSWSPVAGAVSYDVQTSSTVNFAKMLADKHGVAGTSILVAGGEVAASGTTYWRVRSVAGSLSSAWSPVQSFTVKVAPAQPQQTVLVLHVGDTQMTVDGVAVTIDVAPQIVEGRTLLPIKWVAEPLGAAVGWDAATRKVTVSLGGTTIELWIGKSQARVNSRTVMIDPQNAKVAPLIVSGRTMLPVRFIAEQLGADVQWDGATRTATITYQRP